MTSLAAASAVLSPSRTGARARADREAALIVLLLATLCAVLLTFLLDAPRLWVIGAIGYAAVVMLEPKLGLYALLGAVAIDAAPYDPITAPFWRIFASTTVNMTPVEMLIVWTALAALLRSALDRRSVFPQPLLIGSMAVLVFLLLQAVLLGVSAGGDLTIALWEVRALIAALPVMIATRLLVRDGRDLRQFAIVLGAFLLLMTLEAFWRYITYVRPGTYAGALEFAYTHETSVLVSLLMSMCAAWALWGPNRKERLFALAICLLCAIVLMAMRRRAGLIAGEAGLVVVGLFLLLKEWRRFLLIAPVVIIVFATYLALFWNNPNSLGQPARAFRAVFDSEATDGRDQASDAYRRAEKLNVWTNIQANPLEGSGFGVPYAKPYRMVDLSSFWPFWDFIPHNTILWLWMKAGLAGFLSFWFLVGVAVASLVEACKATRERLLIATCAVATAFLTMLVLFSYVDLGLVNARLMIMFGVSLGLIGTLRQIIRQEGPQPIPGVSKT